MEICNSSLCCGCALCAQVCQHKAVEMIADREGFLRPQVNFEKCVSCGLCSKKCPVNKRETVPVKKTYAAYARDEGIRKTSSSGGIFSLLAEAVLEGGGAVVGAGYGEKLMVIHKAVEDKESLKELKGSKYVQSSMGSAYESMGKYLSSGRTVLFSGTPCQCSAVRNMYGEREELLLCDFICHGVPSPSVWEKYISEEFPSAENASFRDKKLGWQEFSMKIEGADLCYSASQYKDPYLRLFLKNLILRPSCYQCSWKGDNYASDITLADFWGISKVDPAMNDDKGTSVVIVRSEKGWRLYDGVLKGAVSKEVVISSVSEINTAYGISAKMPKEREAFFSDMEKGESLKALKAKYYKPISSGEILKLRIKRTAKKLLGRIYRIKAKRK